MTLKYGNFETIELPNDYVIVQPPAGLLTSINKRLEDYKENNNNVVTLNAWGAVFILACLHKKHDNGIEPVCVQVAKNIADQYNTLLDNEEQDNDQLSDEANYFNAYSSIKSVRDLFVKASKAVFNEVVDELLFVTTLDQLREWFDAIDKSSFITKKTENDLKKATFPEA